MDSPTTRPLVKVPRGQSRELLAGRQVVVAALLRLGPELVSQKACRSSCLVMRTLCSHFVPLATRCWRWCCPPARAPGGIRRERLSALIRLALKRQVVEPNPSGEQEAVAAQQSLLLACAGVQGRALARAGAVHVLHVRRWTSPRNDYATRARSRGRGAGAARPR
jgi:hypothetical protein